VDDAPRARLIRKEAVAEGTMAFYFERPAGFSFEAGQNAFVSLVDPAEDDDLGPSRPFTFASAPGEPELMIATRMRNSAFKRTLRSAAPGLEVTIAGPSGEMLLHEDASRPAVFIAGGIGITPFVSMIRHAVATPLGHSVTLFYSNRTPEEAAFLEELQSLEKRDPCFRLVATMTRAASSNRTWSGETARISPDLLARHAPRAGTPVYYFAGPPEMTTAVQFMLSDIGVADENMRFEEFYGY
jgi:ferredoxin-NADP reductase